MMEDSQQSFDQNLSDSISMLKQILEVMPDDVEALHAVYKAYRGAGEYAEAFEYLKRLVRICIDGDETASFSSLQDELRKYKGEHPEEVTALLERLDVFSETETAVADSSLDDDEEQSQDVNEELALVWRLYEEGQLEQDDYLSVLHDLTEVSEKEVDVPVSMLHTLNDRGFTHMNRIMNYLSSRSGVPCISLSSFELPKDVSDMLPDCFRTSKGAFPFGEFGDDLLVAVLNPFNHALMQEVEEESGRRCHTYLVMPDEYDRSLERIRAAAIKAQQSSA